MFTKTPAILKNPYFIMGGFFVVWMLFLDSNDLLSRLAIRAKVKELENAKVYYQEKIEEVKKDREELMTNPALLEKFAREKYMMKKKKEDVFIIEKSE